MTYRSYLTCYFARSLEHRLEQYLTDGQSLSHFLRHVNGRWQTGQILLGSSDFFIIV